MVDREHLYGTVIYTDGLHEMVLDADDERVYFANGDLQQTMSFSIEQMDELCESWLFRER